MKKSILFLGFLVALGACKKEAPDAGQLAAVAAKGYYDLLLEGKYRDFVAGIRQQGKIPQGYHDQLVMNAQMFMEQQKKEHRGISRVDVLNASADTAHHVANVFLNFVYGDSTKEQVVVPMVESHGEWKMR